MFIDGTITDAICGQDLPKDHPAMRLAARTPRRHPLRELLTGEFRWLARQESTWVLFCAIFEIFGEPRETDDVDGPFPSLSPSAQAAVEAELAYFKSRCDGSVILAGRRHNLYKLYRRAARDLASLTALPEDFRRAALAALDRTVAHVIRDIRTR
jgi:hypothetical protein